MGETPGRRAVSIVIAVLLLTVAALAAALYFAWPKLVFAPVYYDERDLFRRMPERFHPLQLLRDENIVLEGIVYTPENPECTVLYFGGREQDGVALVAKLCERFPAWRIVAFNYRGYGLSEGAPSESALLEDAAAIAKAMRTRFGDIVLMGYSLGASVAAFAASRTDTAQLILVAPFYDIHTVVRTRVPGLPKWLLRCRFETARYLGGVTSPVSIFAGTEDTLATLSQSRALREKVHRLAMYKEYSGYNHEEILGGEAFVADVQKVCR